MLATCARTDTLTAACRCSTSAARSSARLSAFMAGSDAAHHVARRAAQPGMVQGFWRLVARYRATLVGGVPTSLGAVLEVPLAGADICAVRAGFCGAASLPPAVGERFRQMTGRATVRGLRHDRGLGPDRDRSGRRRRRRSARSAGRCRTPQVVGAPARGRRSPRRGLRAERDRRDHGARAARVAGLPQSRARRAASSTTACSTAATSATPTTAAGSTSPAAPRT